MRKQELRKLRSLPPTKEMIEKAKDNKIHEKIKGIGYSAYYSKRYKYFLRVQNLDRYIKIAVYPAENLAVNIKTPSHEVFLNPVGEEYITRLFDDKGKETGWSKAMFYNLPGLNVYWWLSSQYQHTFWLNRDATRTLKSLNVDGTRHYRNENDAICTLREWQQSLVDNERALREKKETAPWDEDMKLTPELPKDFDKWLKYSVPTEEWGIYKGGEKTTFCTHCEKEVVLTGTRKAGIKMICPSCKKELEIIQGERYKNHIQSVNITTQILQPIKDGYMIREFFSARKIFPKDRKVSIYKQETRRIITQNGNVKTYWYTRYKNRDLRWCLGDNRTYWWNKTKVYTKNLSAISKAVGPGTALPLALKAGINVPIDEYLYTEQGNPLIEKLVKVGLIRLAKDFIEEKYNHAKNFVNQDATELTKMLKIDKMRLKRLQEMEDANITALVWMQQEKNADTVWPEELIKFFTELCQYPDDLYFKPKKMGFVEFKNYIEKQTVHEDCKYNIIKNHADWIRALNDTIDRYRDYLNMAGKLKMRVELEYIYKPKDLREAHDRAVELSKVDDMMKKAKEMAKRFKGVEKNLKDLGKYEYEDSCYKIVAPKNIFDIVREGTILGHCIHTCDYYFERIQTKESFILFLRKTSSPESPWYTIEIEPGGNIRQKRTTGDKQGPELEEALPFLKKYQKQLQKKLTAEDKKLAQAADVKRKTNYKNIRKEDKRVWHGIHKGELLADVLEADFMAAI